MDELMRDRFMELVYDLLRDDDSNQRANAIINCADEYAESMKQQWIPVEERLPEEPYGCLVTVWDTNPITMDEFENILPYFVGWDGEQWNDGDGEQCPFEVIAWMPLPECYQVKGEQDE